MIPTLAEAADLLQKAGHDVFSTAGKIAATNGEADGIAIRAQGGIEIFNFQIPFDVANQRRQLDDLPRIVTPHGFHLYIQSPDSEPPQVIAADLDAKALISTVAYGVTFPTPGYTLAHGRLSQIPKVSSGRRQTIIEACVSFNKLPRKTKDELALEIMREQVAILEPEQLPVVVEHRAPPLRTFADQAVAAAYSQATKTHHNVAQAFEDRFKEEFRFCNAWGKWLKWDESRWKSEGTQLAFDYTRQLAADLNLEGKVSVASAGFSHGVESFCRASRVFATEWEFWDSDVMLLNCPKGTVDLRDGLMREHRQADHLTKRCSVSPNPGPRPLFDKFLKEITLDDYPLQRYLQTSLGACLSGAAKDHWLIVWYGAGRNGKSTLAEIVAYIMGDYAKTVPMETLLSRQDKHDDTLMANLQGLRLAVSNEVSEGSFFDETKIKALTGDAKIAARKLYGEPFEFTRSHKHLILGQHRPMLRVVDIALRSRLHLVEFKADYSDMSKADLDMGKKLMSEAPQILQWLIDGHTMWLDTGHLARCSSVQAATDDYLEAQSTPEMWLRDCCVVDDAYQCQAKNLYGSFKSWKEGRGEGVLSQMRWSEWMAPRFQRKRAGQANIYIGIDLRPISVLD